jgi:hypothetical protein
LPILALLVSLSVQSGTHRVAAQVSRPKQSAATPSVDFRHGALQVSENRHFLQHSDGTPFFYLGDTAWELFHRLDRAEAERYLENRRQKRFTVIQAVALSEVNGLNQPNAYGDKPLLNDNPVTPDTTAGADPNDATQYDYWDHVDYIVDTAAAKGLYTGMLPTWGDKWNKKWGSGPEIFTPENAQTYGEWLGRRYLDKPIIWILGGDRPVETERHSAIIRALARGLRQGDGGKHLITFHPMGGGTSAQWFHADEWLGFNMNQTGHCTDTDVWNRIARDYNRVPAKPVLDAEPLYEDHPICFNARENGYSDAYEIRKFAYWDVFAGAAGHTYGNHTVWQMHAPRFGQGVNGPTAFWYEAVDHPGATQMTYLRQLMEARPFLSRVPDQSLLASDAGQGTDHVQATRGDGYAFVYSASGKPFTLNMSKIPSTQLKGYWYSPRDGTHVPAGTFASRATQEFVPPGSGRNNDWILVLDDAARKFAPPGKRGNVLPVVQLEMPPQSQALQSPASLTLTAISSDTDGKVRLVELLENDRVVAKSTTARTQFKWAAPKRGIYKMAARVTDDRGGVTVSKPMEVTAGPLQFEWYRGINFNGPSLTIDGKQWEGQSEANLSFRGSTFENQSVPLQPATDEARARMIRSSIWNSAGSNFTVRSVPNGTYRVYLYLWEDNASVTFDVRLQDKLVQSNVRSGVAGEWKRLGPWITNVTDGTIRIVCSAGDANLSGVELWKLAPGG